MTAKLLAPLLALLAAAASSAVRIRWTTKMTMVR